MTKANVFSIIFFYSTSALAIEGVPQKQLEAFLAGHPVQFALAHLPEVTEIMAHLTHLDALDARGLRAVEERLSQVQDHFMEDLLARGPALAERRITGILSEIAQSELQISWKALGNDRIEFLAPSKGFLASREKFLRGGRQVDLGDYRETIEDIRSELSQIISTGKGSAIYFKNARFPGADFSGFDVKLAGAMQLNHADLRFSKIVDSRFNRAQFVGTRFDFSNLSGTSFHPRTSDSAVCRVKDFCLSFLGLNSANPASNFKNAFFIRAKLVGTDFSGADLTEAVFENAVMKDANLSAADLSESNLNGADLTGAKIDSKTRLKGAKFNDTTKLPFPEAEAFQRGMIRVPAATATAAPSPAGALN